MAGTKRTNVEIDLIVNQLCLLLIKGYSRRVEIIQYVTKMDHLPKEEREQYNWIRVGKCLRTLDKYLAMARKVLAEGSRTELDNARALYTAQLEDLYKKAVSQGKIRTANNILKNKMYLQGLGGLNINSKVNMKTYDVALTPEEEAAFDKEFKDFFGSQLESVIDKEDKDD
jgi:hypothetical protein